MARSNEPFFWLLFSSGGTLAALLFPALVAVLFVAAPLGWVALPAHGELLGRLAHPLVRFALWGVVTLALFHWAHRFRFTLYDGLQLSHLYGLIATITYGGATVLTLLAGYLLWTFP
jgi:fumarate reductase subunit D